MWDQTRQPPPPTHPYHRPPTPWAASGRPWCHPSRPSGSQSHRQRHPVLLNCFLGGHGRVDTGELYCGTRPQHHAAAARPRCPVTSTAHQQRVVGTAHVRDVDVVGGGAQVLIPVVWRGAERGGTGLDRSLATPPITSPKVTTSRGPSAQVCTCIRRSLLGRKDVHANEGALGVAVLAGLGGGHIHDLEAGGGGGRPQQRVICLHLFGAGDGSNRRIGVPQLPRVLRQRAAAARLAGASVMLRSPCKGGP